MYSDIGDGRVELEDAECRRGGFGVENEGHVGGAEKLNSGSEGETSQSQSQIFAVDCEADELRSRRGTEEAKAEPYSQMTTLAHDLVTVHSLPSPSKSCTFSVCRGVMSSMLEGDEAVCRRTTCQLGSKGSGAVRSSPECS